MIFLVVKVNCLSYVKQGNRYWSVEWDIIHYTTLYNSNK